MDWAKKIFCAKFDKKSLAFFLGDFSLKRPDTLVSTHLISSEPHFLESLQLEILSAKL
jgi:hypothetical protein